MHDAAGDARLHLSRIHIGNLSPNSAAVLPKTATIVASVDTALKVCFHYGCALRCMARDIEMPIVFLFFSPRNATQLQRAAVMEIGSNNASDYPTIGLTHYGLRLR